MTVENAFQERLLATSSRQQLEFIPYEIPRHLKQPMHNLSVAALESDLERQHDQHLAFLMRRCGLIDESTKASDITPSL